MDGTTALLQERGKTHGDFSDHARITQNLKIIIFDELMQRAARGQEDISDVAGEAIDMILHKIGRIVAGRWDHVDHWDDICGYAKLVADRIRAGKLDPSDPMLQKLQEAFRGADAVRATQSPIGVIWGHHAGDDPGDTT